MNETYLNVPYSISRRYVSNPLTGDRYFSGYEAKIVPNGAHLPIVIGVFRSRRQAIKQTKESIVRFREEFTLDTSQDRESDRIAPSTVTLMLSNLLTQPFKHLSQFLPQRSSGSNFPKSQISKSHPCKTER